MNARPFRYDPNVDRVADLIEAGPTACAGVHPKLLDHAQIYKDFRDHYRAAVNARVLPDDRGPDTYQPPLCY